MPFYSAADVRVPTNQQQYGLFARRAIARDYGSGPMAKVGQSCSRHIPETYWVYNLGKITWPGDVRMFWQGNPKASKRPLQGASLKKDSWCRLRVPVLGLKGIPPIPPATDKPFWACVEMMLPERVPLNTQRWPAGREWAIS